MNSVSKKKKVIIPSHDKTANISGFMKWLKLAIPPNRLTHQ
jgi:hypothetical protein